MIKNNTHTCTFAADPLSVFPAHLKTTEKWKGAAVMVKKRREQGALLTLRALGLFPLRAHIISIRKEIPDKSKPEIIKALLLSLEEEGVVYQTQVSVKENEQSRVTA